MDNLFLTFIVPVYNAEAYLAETLNSLLAQDIEDYEILCVNDGSTDSSAQILQYYADTHPNLRTLHQENAGVVAARNRGLENARGRYIWFVDADDLVRENILGSIQSLAAETNCDRIVVNGYTFTDTLTPEEQSQAQSGTLPCNVPWQDSVVWRSILRRDFLLSNSLTFRYPALTHGEDGIYMYEVSHCDPLTESLPLTGYFYRLHSGSAETLSTPAQHRKKLRSYLSATEILHNYYHSGRRDHDTANRLMTFLWFALYEAAQLPSKEAKTALTSLRALGLYPTRPLPECDLESTYLTSRDGLAGKILDKLLFRITTPWGFTAVRFLLAVKNRL